MVEYITLAFWLFFITYLLGGFYEYYKTRTLTTNKMLSFKKGGLFAHYRIVGVIVVVLVFLDLMFDLNPMDTNNVIGFTLQTVTTFITAFIFVLLLVLFMTMIGLFIIAKVRNINPRAPFIQHHTNNAFTVIFVITFVIAILVLLVDIFY